MVFKGNLGSFGDYIYAVAGLIVLILSVILFIAFLVIIILAPMEIYIKIKKKTQVEIDKIHEAIKARGQLTDEEKKEIEELKEKAKCDIDKIHKEHKLTSERKIYCIEQEYEETKKMIELQAQKRTETTEEELRQIKQINKKEKRNITFFILGLIVIYVPIVLPLILMGLDFIATPSHLAAIGLLAFGFAVTLDIFQD